MQPSRQLKPFAASTRAFGRPAFTLTELLVVIGIIVVLVGILLPALANVRQKSMATSTHATMDEFSKACDIYQGDHGVYPGALPDEVVGGLTAPDRISGTENALLALMGGLRVITPFTMNGSTEELDYQNFLTNGAVEVVDPAGNGGWGLAVNTGEIGQGPIVNTKPYSPYFSPSGSEVRRAQGQDSLTDTDNPLTDEFNLPDLVDRWGQPILYFRASRNNGPIAPDAGNAAALPQFILSTADPYIESVMLGEARENQVENSLFNVAPDTSATFAQIIRSPSQGAPDDPLYSTPRGKYAIMSAGPDGIFFSQFDGPGKPGDAVTNIVTGQHGNPEVVKEYDDVVVMGGG